MNRNWYEPEPGFKDLGMNRTEPNRGFDVDLAPGGTQNLQI